MIAKAILNLGNRKEPVKYTVVADEVRYLSTGFTSRSSLSLIKTEIMNDDGFLFGTSEQSRFTSIYSTSSSTSDRNPNQLSCTPEEIKLRSCIPYFIQNIINAKRKMIITRQYKGIVETFSELGGLIDMLFLIFYFPYAFYNGRVVREFLVEKVHGLTKPKKHKISKSTSSSDQSGSATALYQQSLKEYKSHIEQADRILDILSISRDLETLKKVVKQLQSDTRVVDAEVVGEPGEEPWNMKDSQGAGVRSSERPKQDIKPQPLIPSKGSLKIIKPFNRTSLAAHRAASIKNAQSVIYEKQPLEQEEEIADHRQIEPVPIQNLGQPSFVIPPNRSVSEFA